MLEMNYAVRRVKAKVFELFKGREKNQREAEDATKGGVKQLLDNLISLLIQYFCVLAAFNKHHLPWSKCYSFCISEDTRVHVTYILPFRQISEKLQTANAPPRAGQSK